MKDLVWRSRARVIAWIELVRLFHGIVFEVYLVIKGGFLAAATRELELDDAYELDNFSEVYKQEHENVNRTLVIIYLVMGTIVFSLRGFVVALLFLATKKEKDTTGAFKLARIWLIMNLIFVILGSIAHFSADVRWLAYIIRLVIHGSFMFVVFKFVMELSKRKREETEMDSDVVMLT